MPSNFKKATIAPDSSQSSLNDTNSSQSTVFSQIEAANLVEGSLRSAALTLASRHPQVGADSKKKKRKNSHSVSQLSDSSNSDFSTLNSTPGSSSALVSLVQQSEKDSVSHTPSNEKEDSGADCGLNPIDKRQKRLLRNRLAAQESRQKKKNYLTNLENKIKEFEDQNLVLFHHLVNLTEQLNSGSILNDLVGSSSSTFHTSLDNKSHSSSQFNPATSEFQGNNSEKPSTESILKNNPGNL